MAEDSGISLNKKPAGADGAGRPETVLQPQIPPVSKFEALKRPSEKDDELPRAKDGAPPKGRGFSVTPEKFGRRYQNRHSDALLDFSAQPPQVQRFLFATQDYFDILDRRGSVSTPHGNISYLAKVVVGARPCVLIDGRGNWDTVQFRNAAAFMLASEWQKFRFIVLDADGSPLNSDGRFSPWNALEMPSFKRTFHMLCWLKYREFIGNNEDCSEKAWSADEIYSLNIPDMIIEFMGRGSQVTKGLTEFDEIKPSLIRPGRAFSDSAAAAVTGLYIIQCVSGPKPVCIKIKDGLPEAEYGLRPGRLCFRAGRLAAEIFGNPGGKKSFAAAVRAVAGLISSPSFCVPAAYAPFAGWTDNISDHLEDSLSYGVALRKGEDGGGLPLFAEAHRRLINTRIFEKRALLDGLDADDETQPPHFYAFLWCAKCQRFVESDCQAEGDFLSGDPAGLLAELTGGIKPQFCPKCRRQLTLSDLRYSACCLAVNSPCADVWVEMARMDDERLLSGWGVISRGDDGVLMFREQPGSGKEDELFEHLGRFSSVAAAAKICIRRAEDIYLSTGRLTGFSLNLGRLLKAEVSASAASSKADPEIRDTRNGRYFAFPMAGAQTSDVLLNSYRFESPRLRLDFLALWEDLCKELAERLEQVFERSGRSVEVTRTGDSGGILSINSEEAVLKIDAAEETARGLRRGLMPEAAFAMCAYAALEKFRGMEKARSLADEISAEENGVRIDFNSAEHSYQVYLSGRLQRVCSCEELIKAPEGPASRAAFCFSCRPFDILRCRCGSPAGISSALVPSGGGAAEFIPIRRMPEAVIANGSRDSAMLERYADLQERRRKAPAGQAVIPEEIYVPIQTASRSKSMKAGAVIPAADDPRTVYDSMFLDWYPLMDKVMSINASSMRLKGAAFVYAVCCHNHFSMIRRSSLEAMGLKEEDLERRMQLTAARCGGCFDVYKFGGITAVCGERAGALAFDPKMAAGVCKSAGISLSPFFKMTVLQGDIMLISDLDVSMEELRHTVRRLNKRRNGKTETGFSMELVRAAFCTVPGGAFKAAICTL